MGSCERDPQKDNGNDPIPSTIIKQNHRLKNWGSVSGNISTFFFFFCLIKLQRSMVTSFFVVAVWQNMLNKTYKFIAYLGFGDLTYFSSLHDPLSLIFLSFILVIFQLRHLAFI